jgi:hypothetical protein
VEASVSELLMTCRNVPDDVKIGIGTGSRDKLGAYLCRGQAASGIEAARTYIRLLYGTCEPVAAMRRENVK